MTTKVVVSVYPSEAAAPSDIPSAPVSEEAYSTTPADESAPAIPVETIMVVPKPPTVDSPAGPWNGTTPVYGATGTASASLSATLAPTTTGPAMFTGAAGRVNVGVEGLVYENRDEAERRGLLWGGSR
ncbi:hypothetical protein K402DRAFT_155399 [Aulographum hederae CBS 113979]|uniref:Uncharacterized protein n=1 Tax=Aulographum hederae CBS 113979 TaxID=1176131 RepID=A0A6G1GSI3_9PEZI|nr:hypothetical protein K402DRAFT_155399 [Aulographum hederae CBS 113979]